ncbi:NADase-type glycan-binding domain-containing protein [Streptomyces pinistramenti]|uniref:NADase-type glycan-binding domain-containing protein n=1 Tax=Streptomyces pinistramenti TaxID=2884812 RepID=UPI001D08C58B|nr:zinc ribbon domain-containing protein [Streptomyces pinistramenti]MCB5909117.1 zinc ribbon domain-containing protein [Streptomyces pinistramenti]
MTSSRASGARGGEERVLACDQCGTRHEPGQPFCDTCGAVLRWTPGSAAATGTATDDAGTQAATAPSAEAEPDADRTPTEELPPVREDGPAPRAGASAPVPPYAHAAGAGQPAGRPADQDGQPPGHGAGCGFDAGPLPAEAGTGADTGSATDRARALLVPVADPQGPQDPPPSVAPVLPGRPAPARPEVRTPGEQELVGGIACPWCGTANQPTRHFCSRCAMRMARGPVNPARRPWWRRLLDHRNREAPWAGDRPRLRRQLGRILRWVVGAAVLALVVTGLFHIGQAVDAISDHVAKRAPVTPDSYQAKRSYPGHGPNLAFDPFNNTWWGPGVTPGEGEWLEARFDEPARLLDIGITPGESTHADTLGKSSLPHRIEARITTDDGKVTTEDIVLDQGSGFQHRPFRFQNVTSVRFTVRSVYSTAPKKQVAIAAIEFFGPSHGGS